MVRAFADAASAVDSRVNHGVTSDAALAVLRPALTKFGFEIEASKTASGKIRRPVLFGENGRPIVAYEVDGFHPGLGIVLEVEAGRGAAGNADYRDLIRTSLIVDAEYLVLGMMLETGLAGRRCEATSARGISSTPSMPVNSCDCRSRAC